MATALDRLGDASVATTVTSVAHERGIAVGREARRNAGPRPGRRRLVTELLDVLLGSGYAPDVDRASGTVSLRNCPYDTLASSHRELMCGMNLAWAGGLAEALAGSRLRPELAPGPGHCCVVFRPANGPAADGDRSDPTVPDPGKE